MTWVAAAIAGGTLLSAGAGIISANKANKAEQGASNASIAENRREFDLVRGDTAGQRFVGNGATNLLARLYGYGAPPTRALTGPGSETFAGATPAGFAPIKTSVPGGKLNIGGTAIAGDSLFSKVHDPFASRHGDENRNLQAFAAESGVMQLPDGRLALPNGAIFDQSQLKDVAGTWYGAVHAPDGDQQDWQQRYQALVTNLGGGSASAQSGGNAGGGLTSDGVPNTAPLGTGVTIDNATGAVTPNAGAPGTPDMSAFFTSPDYQFRLSEGQKAIDRSAAARGGLLSGRTVKAGEGYASNLASGEFGAFVDRLMQQAGLGAAGVNTSAAAGANTTNNITNAVTNAGNARASSYLQTGSSINNAVQGGLSNLLLSRYLSPAGG